MQHQTTVSNTMEKLNENIEEQREIINSKEVKLTRIDLEKKQKQENERKCRDEEEQIEAKIIQLQKEKRAKSDLGRSLREDIDRMSQEHLEVQYLISQFTYKKNELSKRYTGESEKEKECSQTIYNLQIELHKLELQSKQRSANRHYDLDRGQIPRQRPNGNENGKY